MLNAVATIVLPLIAGLAVSIGGAMMLALKPELRRAATACFVVAGFCVWVVGVGISLQGEGTLAMKMAVAFVTGGLAAAATVWIISITNAQEAAPRTDGKEAQDIDRRGIIQNNSGSPNYNVHGSGNTFNYNTPSAAASVPEKRDPDGLYQLGDLVGTVAGARIDLGNSLVHFDVIRSQGNLDQNREIEYRQYVIKCEGIAGAPKPNTIVGTFVGVTAGAQCRIIRKR